ncbi:hypothetical protein ASD54_10960 [Rhizobium sp. Root149]|nr:Arc family DNA-binding protein [Rhizobium sp. Root149]KQZ50721.1 hypothetical protein ASD54_10960 [Rhizobium sp. Root149]
MARGDFPSAKQDQFNLRLPDGMRERIAEAAKKSGRSMNAEIVHRLANSLESASYADYSLGLGEPLDEWLMFEANFNNRSLREEMIARLYESLKPQEDLVNELRNRGQAYERENKELASLLLQLTPEERRLLEERREIAAQSLKKVSSKQFGKFIKLNPIGNRGRFTLSVPKSEYAPLFEDDVK